MSIWNSKRFNSRHMLVIYIVIAMLLAIQVIPAILIIEPIEPAKHGLCIMVDSYDGCMNSAKPYLITDNPSKAYEAKGALTCDEYYSKPATRPKYRMPLLLSFAGIIIAVVDVLGIGIGLLYVIVKLFTWLFKWVFAVDVDKSRKDWIDD